MAFYEEVMADNPAVFLLFEETSGTPTNYGSLSLDSYSTTSTVIDGGLNGNALSGGSTTLTFANAASTRDYSIEFWFKPDAGFTSANNLVQVLSGSSTIINCRMLNDTYLRITGTSNADDTVPTVAGKWNHLALSVSSGSSYNVTLNGISLGTFNSGNFFANKIILGDAAFKIDNFVYFREPYASPARLEVHRTAGFLPPVVNVDVATAATSAAATEPTYAGPKTDLVFTADTATASTTAFDTEVAAQFVYSTNFEPSSDYMNSTAENTNPMHFNSLGDKAFFRASKPTDVNNTGFVGATFKYVMGTGSNTIGLSLRAITDPVLNTFSATGIDANAASNSVNTYDISSLITDVNTFYGVALVISTGSTANAYVYSKEDGTVNNRPTFNFQYEIVPEVVDFAANTATISTVSADATVETTTEVAVETATANLSAFEATADTIITPDADINTATAQAFVDSYEAEFSLNVSTDLSSPNGSIESYDVTVQTTESAIIDAETPRILTTHIGLTDVNGQPIVPTEDEDPYFESTMYNNPTIWYRFDDAIAPPVPRVYNTVLDLASYAGSYTGGVTVGLNDGPNGRKHAAFDGTGMFRQYEFASSSTASDERFSYNSSLEFSIRTTKDNQFIMRMDDTRLSEGDVLSSFATPRDFYLSDGKLQYKVWTRPGNKGQGVGEVQWTGFTDIADGEWHHIVIVSQDDQPGDVFTGARMNVYVDGEFELRRRGYGVSFPDYIGGRPIAGIYYPAFPQSEWFVGDISEVILYNKRSLDQERVHAQYDNIFGFQPVYAETAKANVIADEATVKSNTKRVLVVGVDSPEPRVNWLGNWLRGYATEIDGVTFGFNNLDSVIPKSVVANLETAYKAGEYQLFYANATSTRYDERTGEPRLIDLEVDVNLDDYDIVTVSNLPDDSNDYDYFEKNFGRPALFGGLNARKQIEKIVDDVRAYAIRGGSVWVSDPVLAIALGVIDDVAFVPQITDAADPGAFSVNGTPSKDLRSALINPWGSGAGLLTTNVAENAPLPQVTEQINRAANLYRDTHGNYLQRVVNTIEGLTDQPGEILTEAMEFHDQNQRSVLYYAEKWKPRPNGLSVGDEFWIMGTPYGGEVGGADRRTDTPPLDNRTKGYPAAPVTAVKAGVVVTSFAASVWQGATLVANPYRDYAVTVAVRPGDTLGSDVVAGRIFVSFTGGLVENASKMDYSIHDVIPPNEEISRPEWREGAYAREWSESWWRGSWGGGRSLEETNSTVVIDGDTVTTIPGTPGLATAPELTRRWPRRAEEAPSMNYRGLKWLSNEPSEDGSTSVGLATAGINTSAETATADGQRSADVTVATARVITNSFVDADTVSADADVLVSTPTVTVRAQPFTEAVDLSTASITIRTFDDADGIQLTGDWVVLRLPTHTKILTMEDK